MNSGRISAVVAHLLLLAGCAAGPDFQRPAAPGVKSYTREALPALTAAAPVRAGEAQKFLDGKEIDYQWWKTFQSPQLDALVERSLKTNPSVQAAQAALRQAHELVFAQQGFYYPTVQASVSPSRQSTSATISPVLNSGATVFNLYTAQLAVGYTPDVFGANRRQVEALRASAETQHFQLEATYLTLASNVVAAAMQEASLNAQIAATQEIIKANTQSLAILKKQFELGYAAGLDVAAAETALAQVEQSLPPLQKQLEQTHNMLAALAGRYPGDAAADRFELTALRLPQELPLSLPSKLVEQRPDVRAAEAQVHSASALVGVAVTNMLPQFTISAATGGAATVFSQMFATGNPFWAIAGNVSQTLFAGGTLLHRKRAAEAAFEQSTAQYKTTVISAFQNVADTLYALKADADALSAAAKAHQAAETSLSIVRRQLELGQVSGLVLLNAQQAYQQTVLALAQAQANRLMDTAALFQALGGGWWNRPDSIANKR